MSKATALSTYRNLSRLIRNLPSEKERIKNINTLRTTYQANANLEDKDKIEACIKEAAEKIAYLRIITPKGNKFSSYSSDSTNSGTKRFIYTKDGVVEIDGNGGGTKRDSNGRVVSNWDGKNLDPCSVKTHKAQLKRMGFVNNLHAKGIF
mmetsp:Transcript_8997/g.11279  ORF Transcript_8997/g.11279 Transcript_8997/m.11279 type:complete len:150 (+) Transcript_8997:107-556(+)